MTGHQHEQRHSAALFEREQEIAAAERAVDAFCGHAAEGDTPRGGLLLYSGEAGLGKTALLAEVRRIAMERGHCTVLSARGGESVRSVPFHVVRQLLQPAIVPISEAERRGLFAAWYDIAGPALGVAPPRDQQPDPQGVRDGIDWVVTRLAVSNDPLVLIIDDAHWADAESLAWLTSFAVRLPELPLLVVLSYRPDELPEHAPAFAGLVGGRDVRPVALRELTPAAVAELVRTTLGEGADDPFCREVWAVTGGNPYEAVELIAKARDRAIEPVEDCAALLRDLGAEARGTGLVARLAGLGTEVTRFAWAAAVLGTEISPRLAANLAAVSPATAAECADRLREARILTGSSDLEFVHPLIATAIYQAIPAAFRTAMHGQAAFAVTEEGHGPAAASRHLLEVHPEDDPDLVKQLRAAAQEHLAVGAPHAARRCLERALQEPPPDEERAALLYELGCSALLTSPHTTIGHLREALSLPGLPEELRVDATYRLSQVYGHNSQLPEAAEVVAAEASRTPAGPGLMRLQVAHYLWTSTQVDEVDSIGRARRIAAIADRLDGADDAERALLALRAFDGMIRGENALRVSEIIDRALVDGRLTPGLGWTNTQWGFEIPSVICLTLAYTDRLDDVADLSDEAARAFEIAGWSGAHLAYAHDIVGLVHRRRGQLELAETFLREGLRLAGRHSPGMPVRWNGTCLLIDTLLARGHVDEAQAVAKANSFGAPYSPAIVMPEAACLAGRLLLARGCREEAVIELEAVGRQLAERGRNNTLWAPWALDLADALADEDPERARALSAEAVQHAARFGTDTAMGEALRRASALAEESKTLSMLECAVDHLRRSPSRYEYAAALVDHGTALRRDGQCAGAAEQLRQGLGLAEDCGADGVAKKAREELAAVGL
ncbi:ATP-binding protein [Streptomyces sp. NPDC057654]|uniref:ATP-binding protein n=1 Tax=Streptomyces sp. NPDC057654 TaxID=3346196 RepID=UPI00368898A4